VQGYIKVYRKMMCSSIWQDPDLFRLWMYCLMKATHKEKNIIIDKREVKLQAGQFLTGRFSLNQEFNQGVSSRKRVKETTLWSWIKKLEKIGNIDIKSFNKYSVITVVNWHEYQDNQDILTTEQQQNNNRTTTEQQQTDTNKNVKNDKNVKELKDSLSQIENLRSRYNIEELKFIDEYLNLISNTRSNGKISDSIVLSQFEYWTKFDKKIVIYSLRTHLNDPKLEKIKENYTRGIMRGTSIEKAIAGLERLENPKKQVSNQTFVNTPKLFDPKSLLED
jgi:hypothetical protein